MTRALITGVAGQDGHYLAELLLRGGVEVHGIVRPGSSVHSGVVPHMADLLVEGEARAVVQEVEPDEVYNLAAISSVARSWAEPSMTARVNGALVAELLGVVHLMSEAGRDVRFVQASSAEIFGAATRVPQDESTPIKPTSPYGAAKAFAHQLVAVYRRAGVHASSCILYNHESPRRPESFVTRKITASVARIASGKQDRLSLGNLDARRDWGWAPEYVDALRRAARLPSPGDYVIATGRSHTVGEFAAEAFAAVGIADWSEYVDVADSLRRPVDAPDLVGDATKARRELDWSPQVTFAEIVRRMVDADLALLGS